MSFPKSKTKRFNEISGCAPPVGIYDPDLKCDNSKGPVSFEKSNRFKLPKDVCSASSTSSLPFVLLTPKKILSTSQCSTDSVKKSAKKSTFASKIQGLEKEIKGLLDERKKLLKDVCRKEEEYSKIESKLQTATREKSYLNANIASLAKELKSLRKGNEILKTKISSLENSGLKRSEHEKDLGQLKENLVKKSQEIDELGEQLLTAQQHFGDKVKECLQKEDELVVAHSQWDDAKMEIDAANDVISELKLKNGNLVDQISDFCSELNTMETRMAELQEFNDKLQKDRQMYIGELDTVRDKHATEIHDFLSKMSDLDSENKKLNLAFNELKLKNELCVQEQELVKQDKACSVTLQEYKNSLEKRIEAQKNMICDFELELEKNNKLIRRLENDVESLQRALEEKEQLLFESRAEKAQMAETVSVLKTSEQSLNENIKVISSKCSELEEMLDFERNTNRQEEDNLDKQLEVTKNSLQFANEQIKELSSTNVSLVSQLSSQKNANECAATELKNLKADLASKSNDFDELWVLSQQKDKDLETMHKTKEMCVEEIECLRQEIEQADERLANATNEMDGIKQMVVTKDQHIAKLTEDKQFTTNHLLSFTHELSNIWQLFSPKENVSIDSLDQTSYIDLITLVHKSISELEQDLGEFLGGHNKQMDELNEDKQNLQQVIDEFAHKYQSKDENIADLTHQNELLKLQVSELNEMKKSWEEEKEVMLTMMVELKEKDAHNEDISTKIANIQFESDSFRKQLETLEDALTQANHTEAILKDHIASLTNNEGDETEISTVEESHKEKLLELENMIKKLKIAEDERQFARVNAQKWKASYEDLHKKILPFKDQLEKFAAEKDELLSQNTETKSDLVVLSHKYATLLGHHNNKQKIKHIMRLKQENLNLKHENGKLKELICRHKSQLYRGPEYDERPYNAAMPRHSLMGKENFPRPLSPSENIRRGIARKSISHNDISRRGHPQGSRVSTNYGLL